MIKLNLGCGIGLTEGFINIDKYVTMDDIITGRAERSQVTGEEHPITKDMKFVQADVLALPFADNYADYIESIDMIEHLDMLDVIPALQEMYRVLKPGGKMHLFTNDFDYLARLWVEHIADGVYDFDKFYDLAQIVYGNQAHPGEYHKTPFTPDFMKDCMQRAGWTKFKIGIYPHGCTDVPPLQTHKWLEGTTVKTNAILTIGEK